MGENSRSKERSGSQPPKPDKNNNNTSQNPEKDSKKISKLAIELVKKQSKNPTKIQIQEIQLLTSQLAKKNPKKSNSKTKRKSSNKNKCSTNRIWRRFLTLNRIQIVKFQTMRLIVSRHFVS